jgi:hypothetical protein
MRKYVFVILIFFVFCNSFILGNTFFSFKKNTALPNLGVQKIAGRNMRLLEKNKAHLLIFCSFRSPLINNIVQFANNLDRRYGKVQVKLVIIDNYVPQKKLLNHISGKIGVYIDKNRQYVKQLNILVAPTFVITDKSGNFVSMYVNWNTRNQVAIRQNLARLR